jgi:hypothetical protein
LTELLARGKRVIDETFTSCQMSNRTSIISRVSMNTWKLLGSGLWDQKRCSRSRPSKSGKISEKKAK